MRPSLLLAAAMTLWLVPALPAASQEACPAIRFAPGTSGGEVRGEAPPHDVLCYSFAAGAGQTAHLRVVSGRNIIFGIDGVTEAQDDFRFRTQRRSYRLRVGQLMRAVEAEPFVIQLSIR